MSAIVHPEGCRCPGCLPAQYVMKPAAPSRSAATRRPDARYAGDDLMAFDLGCLAVVLGFAALSALIGALAKLTADTWWTLAAGAAGLLAIGVMYRVVSTRRVRPPKGRLKVEATPQPPFPSLPVPPPPPPCPHLNAVPVDLYTGERVAYLCPECNEGLPAEFGRLRRPCCGTPHGLWHLDNCPHYREWRDITGQWPS